MFWKQQKKFRLTDNINRQFPVNFKCFSQKTINLEQYQTTVLQLTEPLLTAVNRSDIGIDGLNFGMSELYFKCHLSFHNKFRIPIFPMTKNNAICKLGHTNILTDSSNFGTINHG